MNNNKQSTVKDLAFWKNNAEENYMTTPISVLKYITELETHIELIKVQLPSDEEIDEYVKSTGYYGHCTHEYHEGIQEGAKWMRDKIQGDNK